MVVSACAWAEACKRERQYKHAHERAGDTAQQSISFKNTLHIRPDGHEVTEQHHDPV